MINRGLICLSILFVISLMPYISADQQTDPNSSITGKVTSQNFNLAIQVLATYPNITVYSPKNSNLYWDENVLLNYSSSSATDLWYSLNNGQNITLSSTSLINATNGENVLVIYANNSQGYLSSQTINFNLNTSKLTVEYSNYTDSGATTIFEFYSIEDLQNLTNIKLEEPFYGYVLFREEINVTDINSTNKNYIDINNNLILQYNSLFLNTTTLPNFNKPATIALNNLAFTKPQILKDGSACPSNECIFQSYSSGTLIFNVTHFTTYSAVESPIISNPNNEERKKASSGGGGGASYKKKIDILENKVILSLKQGETRQSNFVIENRESTIAKISLETTDQDGMIFLTKNQFEIMPGQSLTIPFDIVARENIAPDIYIKQIIIKENGNEIGKINAIVDISSKKSLFDVRINLIDSKIKLNEPLIAEIELFNFGDTGRVDTELDYIIKDMSNKEIYRAHETTAVETQLNIVNVIKTTNIQEGTYVLYVRSTYDGNVASSSQWFEIIGEKKDNSLYIYLSILLILIIIGYYYYIKTRPTESWFEKLENKIREERLKRKVTKALNKVEKKTEKVIEKQSVIRVAPQNESKLRKLEQQLKQLDYVHSKGFVDDSEYKETKDNIEREINQLKTDK